MTNRRSFLQMMFGGLAAAVAAPAVEKFVPAGSALSLDFNDYQVVEWWQEFDLANPRSVLIRTPGPVAITQFSIRFGEKVLHEAITDTLDHMAVEVKLRERTYLEVPMFHIVTSGLFGNTGPRHRLNTPLVADGDLRINLEGSNGWNPPPNVRGAFLLSGLAMVPHGKP